MTRYAWFPLDTGVVSYVWNAAADLHDDAAADRRQPDGRHARPRLRRRPGPHFPPTISVQGAELHVLGAVVDNFSIDVRHAHHHTAPPARRGEPAGDICDPPPIPAAARRIAAAVA